MEGLDYDFDQVDDGRVKLKVFRWVCRRPFIDPLGLNDSQVVARSEFEALEYLLDRGGWRDRRGQSQDIERSYEVTSEGGAPRFSGTWMEWKQAVHLGYYPRELVRLPADALTQAVLDSRIVPPPAPKVRRRPFLAQVERFLTRQARYRRFWRGVGWACLFSAGVTLLYVLWQMLLGLLTTYVIVRAVMAGIRHY